VTTAWAANFYAGVATNDLPWPGGIVPYVFTTNVSAAEQVVYLNGMKEWSLSANIQFVPWTTQTNHVILDLDYLQGTNTYVASVPPVMTIDNLSRAQVCHETGHLLGFQHEHVRTDRNGYIIVNFTNIDTGQTTNGSGEGSGNVTSLYLIDSNSTPNGPYDFESVMHYGRTLFSIDPAHLDVLVPQPAYIYEYYNRIGNFALSVGDRAGAAHLYGPPATPLTNIVSTTADGGPGSLRAAIYYANDHPGTTVRFDIPTNDPGLSNGVYTIYPSGQLPPLVANGTVIDATTQPGYSGSPLVALDGSHLVPQIEFAIGGIYIYAGNCILRGLAIDNFTNSGINLLYNDAASNSVQGSYIGLAPNGATAAPNDYEGINITAGARANVIGGANAGQRNVISGNAGYGVTITGTNSNGNVVEGNYIGLNAAGTVAVSNTYNGIGIWAGSSSNIIGGSAAGAGNVISGNVDYGIYISDSNTSGTVVQGNFIGVNAGANAAVSNSETGLWIVGGSSGSFIANNVVSGNGSYGIFISDPGTSNTVVQGNFIGTDARGANALPNGYMGIGVWSGAAGNLIGGTTAAARNIISGNGNNGIGTGGAGSGSNVIEGNYIGVSSNGLSALPNDGVGVYVETSLQSNVIEANVISGNADGGISFYQATNSVVQGNYIGVADDGMTALPNGGIGFYLYQSQSNLIGGTVAGGANVISANSNDGIQLWGSGTSCNTIEDNLIGTTKTGLSPLGNSANGLSLLQGPQSNQITGNVIAASGNYGVAFQGAGTCFNVLQGNYIGVGADGATALGNTWQGLMLDGGASSNTIGLALDGSGAGNIIAYNSYDGLILYNSNTIGDSIRGNSIFGNGSPGIELVPVSAGVGPNDLESPPVLAMAAVFSNDMVIAGTAGGAANRNILIDIYYNAGLDPSGQGRTYAGATTAQTGAGGSGSFSMPLAARLTGQYFTATATDTATGNTSEFSLDIEATNAAGTGPGELAGLQYSGNHGFSFNITLATNQNYTIQVSTNLSISPVWMDLTDFFATNPSAQILDRAATNSRARFYRAVTP
jgi:parallel beta-helix repeat protein